MKKMWLATVAVAVLSLPAMAQNSPTQEPQSGGAQMNQSDQMNQPDTQGANPSGNQQDQMQQGSQDQSSEQQASGIDPKDLNKDQVTQIQQALDQKGFKTKSDGIWGRQTVGALRKFQEQNNIEGKGHLTEDTLAKLGVNLAGQSPSETTGAAPKDDTTPDMKANPPSQNGASPDQSGSGGTNDKQMNPPADNSGSPDQSK